MIPVGTADTGVPGAHRRRSSGPAKHTDFCGARKTKGGQEGGGVGKHLGQWGKETEKNSEEKKKQAWEGWDSDGARRTSKKDP